MFARKLDLDLDPNVLRVWDPWMAAKLAGGRRPAPPQAPIGHSPGDPDLSIRFRPPGMRDEAGEARLEALAPPAPPSRRPHRLRGWVVVWMRRGVRGERWRLLRRRLTPRRRRLRPAARGGL